MGPVRRAPTRREKLPISALARKQTEIRRSILTRRLFGGIGPVVSNYTGLILFTRPRAGHGKHSPLIGQLLVARCVHHEDCLRARSERERERPHRRSGRLYDIIKEITCERERESSGWSTRRMDGWTYVRTDQV